MRRKAEKKRKRSRKETKKKRKRREGGGKMQLLIPAAAGLEGVVKRQLLSLGYPKAPAENGRLALEGDWEDVARLNVFCRAGNGC